MSFTETNSLANKAWAKLSFEAARSDHNLRILVGHANLLCSLTPGFVGVERGQESPFNQSVGDGTKRAESHVQRAGAFTEEPEEDWRAGKSDTSSSSDSDSDDSEEEGIGDTFENPLWLNKEAPDFNKYDWPHHDFWPRKWLLLPIKVSPNDTQCDFCTDGRCHCIFIELPENKPQITKEGLKEQSVRVIGVEGEIVYRKGQILGELLGELVQLDNYDELSNWVRKVSHSCKPSAEFRLMKISGWWRQMLVAIQNIPHNGEVTAHCGEGCLPRGGNKCHCGHCGEHA